MTLERELIGTIREETGLDGCPWCGEDVALAVDNYRGEWAAVAYCDDCGIIMTAEGASKDNAISNLRIIWNTRYERTCHPVWKKLHNGIMWPLCSECGGGLNRLEGRFPKYCEHCGAKVVDE